MDLSSSDLEFFDFKNSSDEEIKEIQAILKGPGSNGCVELPWEICVSNNDVGGLQETEGAAEVSLAFTNKPTKSVSVDPGLNCTQPPTLPLPPTVETFVTLPTTVGPYQNSPYFVSRTIPYLRAYPPMGVPFFACPIPSGEGSPYGQFVPVATEKSGAGQLDNESTSNARDDLRAEKRTESSEPEPAVQLCPSSMPLVPLPPSTFAVAGYPPGLHTLPYPQMAGQATSPAMYYVPVFNHPYGGYLPSPPMMLPETAGVVEIDGRDKVGMPGEAPAYSCAAADCGSFGEATSNVQPECQQDDKATHHAKTTVPDSSLSSSEPLVEELTPSYLQEAWSDCPPEPVAPSLCLQETVASNVVCRSPETRVDKILPNECLPKTVTASNRQTEPVVCRPPEPKVDEISSSECLPKTVKAANDEMKPVVCRPTETSADEISASECLPKTAMRRPSEQVVRDTSRCWADLFKGPREVNGIDRHPPKQRSTLKKDITNGKVYSMPVNH